MAIPEFILRKLIVPDSLKSTTTGFQFVLLNTFAPATITGFSITVATDLIPPDSIRITSTAFEPITAVAITPDAPMLTPVGVAITIDINGHPLNGAVKLSATTKEVGEFEFILAGSQKKISYKRFKPAWTAQFRPALKGSVSVDTNQIIGKASPFLLGQFVEHLERCVYDGIWTKDGIELRTDTLKLIKDLKIPMIRYPGGNFASGYHWEDGIGPREKRPTRHDAAWQAEDSNQVGTDEFLAFCTLIKTEPYFVVNDGSGTPEEAARWVAYCNSPADSEQGRRRAANGHPEPYNVKYWGVGNEVWGPWQIGTTSAKEYSRRLKRFVYSMKAEDPSIKIIAVGNNPLDDDQNNPAALWNEVILEGNGDEIDFLSWHIYQPEQSGWKESYDPQSLHHAICAAPLDFDAIIQRVDRQIQASKGKGKVTQSIDEWNVWLPPGENATSMHQVTYTMRDALYVAGILSVLLRNSQAVGIANLAQLVNVLPLIQTNEKTAIPTAIYYPFILASNMGSDVLTAIVTSPTYKSEDLGENVTSHESVPYLDVAASKSEEDIVSLFLINRHPENRMQVEIQNESADKLMLLKTKTIRAGSPLAYNTFSRPFTISIKEGNKVKVANSGLQIILDPASITLLQYKF